MSPSTLAFVDSIPLKKGIESVNGIFEDDFSHFIDETIFEIGKRLGEGGNFRRSLFSDKIFPVNAVPKFLKENEPFWNSPDRQLKEVSISLRQIDIVAKKIYLVHPTKTEMSVSEIIDLMKWAGLKPCQDAPNYLFGLFAQQKTQSQVQGNLVALELQNQTSLFRSSKGDKDCYIALMHPDRSALVSNENSFSHFVGFISKKAIYLTNDVMKWSFLAEDNM